MERRREKFHFYGGGGHRRLIWYKNWHLNQICTTQFLDFKINNHQTKQFINTE